MKRRYCCDFKKIQKNLQKKVSSRRIKRLMTILCVLNAINQAYKEELSTTQVKSQLQKLQHIGQIQKEDFLSKLG